MMATTKCGAGQEKLASTLAGRVAARGHRAVTIDADDNYTLHCWERHYGPQDVAVTHEFDKTKLMEFAVFQVTRNRWTAIDTPGAVMQVPAFAIGGADLVLNPCQLAGADVLDAGKTG